MNIIFFSENGKVSFTALTPKNSDYLPIRVYRDLPVDPLSSITSVLAKMDEGEGAVIQILVQPTNSKWASLGRSFIAKTKKNEANPEKASFKVDAKMLESVEQKFQNPDLMSLYGSWCVRRQKNLQMRIWRILRRRFISIQMIIIILQK